MMHLRKIFALIFLTVFCLNATAQTIGGRVVNNKGITLEGVSVTLRTSDDRPVAFCNTNEDGTFSIEMPQSETAEHLVFSMIGYAKRCIALNNFKPGQDVVLENDAFMLKEVKVKAEKIRRSGDTLTYSVAAFMQKQDRSIADVIAKMPGLSVSPSGQIKYQGKVINKFYIEGADLLGGKYALASENIKANQVKNVQVLEDHQPVKALKKVKFSDQAALNIVLKDDAKNVWQSVVEAGLGASLQGKAQLLRDAQLLEMLFSKSKQSISMYKTNNTDKDIGHETIDYTAAKASLKADNPLIESVTISTPSISDQRYNFNDTHVFATNWLFKTAKDNDLRLQVNGLIDKTNVTGHTRKTYLDAGTTGVSVTEDEALNEKTNEWSAELTYKVNKDNHYFANVAKGYIGFNRSRGEAMLNHAPILQRANRDKKVLSDNFEWIKTLSNNNTFSIKSRFLYNELPSSLLLVNGSTERISQQKIEWDASTGFRHKLLGMYITYNIGAAYKRQKMRLDNFYTSLNATYTQAQVYVMPSLSYISPSLRLNAGLSGELLYRKYGDESKPTFHLEPFVFANYRLTSRWSADMLFSHALSPNAFSSYIEAPVFTNYYSLIQGKAQLNTTTTNMLSNTWKYNDVIRGLFGNLGLSYSRTSNLPLYESVFEDGFYKSRASQHTSHNTSTSISGGIGKSIGWGKASIELNASASNTKYQLLIAKEVVDFTRRDLSTGIAIAYHPWEVFSIEHKSSYNTSARKGKNHVLFNNRQSFLHHRLRLYFLPGKWQMELSNELFQSQDKSISNSFFTDLSVSYRQKRWEATLIYNNVWGTTSLEQTYNANAQQIYLQTRLRPSELLFKLSFSL
mgnify:FL=1